MALPDSEILKFRQALDECARPLFFFDGDCDGLTSYLLLYKYKKDGRGNIISGRPQLGIEYVRKIEEYQPDAVFILDLAQVTQEFLDNVSVPVHWLDHHDPNNGLHLKKNIHYYNPRLYDNSDGRPTAYWAYRIVENWLWIAMIGIVGDYSFELADEFKRQMPELLPKKTKDQGSALYDTPLGKLVRIVNFNLKGSVSVTMTSVKIFARIDNPHEILEQVTSQGRYVYKKYERVLKVYLKHYEQLLSQNTDKHFLVYTYTDDQFSLSGDLANEAKYRNPKKVVVVGRLHDNKVIMSLRSETLDINDALQKALVGTGGYGGGHPKACGAVVPQSEFNEFLSRFKKEFTFS